MRTLAMQQLDLPLGQIEKTFDQVSSILLWMPLIAGGIWVALHWFGRYLDTREARRKFAVKAERWAERAAELVRLRQALHLWLIDEAFGLALLLHDLDQAGAGAGQAAAAARQLAADLDKAKGENAAALERLERRTSSDPIGDERIPTLQRYWLDLDTRCAAADETFSVAAGTGHRALVGERSPMPFDSLGVAPPQRALAAN